MRLGRGFTAVARRVPRLAGLVWIPAGWPVQTATRQKVSWLAQGAVPLDLGLRAMGAQGCRETCGLAGVLPPWHDGCHGSPVWCGFPLVGRYRLPLDRRSRGLRKGQRPLTPDCVLFAQGRKKTFGLAGVLPPWHDGCHGSPVWCGFPLVGRYRPPSGDRPSGSQQGPVSFRKNVGSLRCRNIQLHVATFQPPL